MPRSAEAFLDLQHSESVVVNAASRIFAAYVQSGQVTAANEAALLSQCVRSAIRLGLEVDRILKSDDEEW